MVQQRRQNSNGTATRRGRIRTQQTAIDYGLSAMSMFMLWMTALIAGRLVAYLKLPEILGILLTGLAFRNITFLHERIFVDATLNNFFRKLAFIVILIRGGIGLEANALRRMRNVILRIGVLAPLVEAAGIACACCFLFDMGVKMALTFGIILAATSPAVSIPAVLVLNKKGFGVPDGVPTVLLVCAAVDNIVLVTPFSVLLELLFNGDGLYTQIALIFAQIATGIALGLFS
ncbi:unnamed protein product, partial [Anisakis simplex]|uniref:Na_H_Exchanger domain-containing protein n=1 Tax=Anisakis simplex TaxID=6269 RepID=A0A0M3KFI9_ANISI